MGILNERSIKAEKELATYKEQVEALKNEVGIQNYICAVKHYTKYDSSYTFCLPNQWFNLNFSSFDNYQEFQMQLVYLLGEAKKKWDEQRDLEAKSAGTNIL